MIEGIKDPTRTQAIVLLATFGLLTVIIFISNPTRGIAVAALCISTVTLYMNFFRKSCLKTTPPLIYTRYEHDGKNGDVNVRSLKPHLHINFLTMLWISGKPTEIVVFDLRLILTNGAGDKKINLYGAGFTKDGKGVDKSSFVVSSAEERHVKFLCGDYDLGLFASEDVWKAEIEYKPASKKYWINICKFDLYALEPEKNHNKKVLNDPELYKLEDW